jgi:ABC-type transport system involved in cytochrome bd biosynthesis fused ATPase/permease subunit
MLGKLRLALFDTLEPRIPGGIIGGGSGSVLSGFVADTEVIASGAAKKITATVDVTASIFCGTLLATLVYPRLGALVLLGTLCVTGGAFAIARLSRRAIDDEATLRSDLARAVIETMRSSRELVAFGRLDLVESQLNDVRQRSRSSSARRALALGAGRAAGIWLSGAALIAIVARGIAANRAHELSGVMLAVVCFAALAVFDQFGALPSVLAETEAARSATRRLSFIAEVPIPAIEPDEDRSPPVGEVEAVLEHATVLADMNLILDDVSLTVTPGERVALVGPSGAGKSTALNVLLHFIECANGRATIGAIDVREMSRDGIARHVGWLPEENHVFAATLRDNLLLANPSASDAECLDALERVGLRALVAACPFGLLTTVGSGGQPLSAGESQRLAMARLILSGATVFLLDEPTAHLDPCTGPQVLADLLGAAGTHSVLVVSHDAEVTRHVDTVISLSCGRITAETMKEQI